MEQRRRRRTGKEIHSWILLLLSSFIVLFIFYRIYLFMFSILLTMHKSRIKSPRFFAWQIAMHTNVWQSSRRSENKNEKYLLQNKQFLFSCVCFQWKIDLCVEWGFVDCWLRILIMFTYRWRLECFFIFSSTIPNTSSFIKYIVFRMFLITRSMHVVVFWWPIWERNRLLDETQYAVATNTFSRLYRVWWLRIFANLICV